MALRLRAEIRQKQALSRQLGGLLDNEDCLLFPGVLAAFYVCEGGRRSGQRGKHDGRVNQRDKPSKNNENIQPSSCLRQNRAALVRTYSRRSNSAENALATSCVKTVGTEHGSKVR